MGDKIRKSLRFDLPSIESDFKVNADPDDLPEDITPAQLTYLHKPERLPIQKQSRRSPKKANISANYSNYYRKTNQPSTLPDDDLFEDLASSTNTEEMLFHERKQKAKPQTIEYEGYYMDQKKRYDEAEFVKPRNYKHKTFKYVFNADRQDDDNYNPIDIVFEDPEKLREMEQKKKFMRAVRTVLAKLGKVDYDSYDYHTQQLLEKERRQAQEARERQQEEARLVSEAKLEQIELAKGATAEQKRIERENAAEEKRMKKQEAGEQKRSEKETARAKKSKSKFRTAILKLPPGKSLVSEEPDVIKVPQGPEGEVVKDVFVDDNDSDYENDPQHPPNKTLRKNIKKKWRQAKKQLGENYFDNYARKIEEEELAKRNLPIVYDEASMTENKEENDHIEANEGDMNNVPKDAERHVGPNSSFNPYWNYILSYLVYEKPGSSFGSEVDAPADKIVEVVEPEKGKKQKTSNQIKEAKVEKSKHRRAKEKRVNRNGKIPSLGFAFNLPKAPKLSLQPAKSVFRNWNTPAPAFFAGRRLSDQRELAMVSPGGQHLERPLVDEHGYPFEHTIIYDGSDVDEELIYDPDSGEFKPLSHMMEEDDGLMNVNGSVVIKQKPAFHNLHVGAPLTIVLNINQLIKKIRLLKILFAPIDVISELYPSTQTIVVLLELGIFMWMLYEVSLLIDALCMTVRAVCAPMIAIGKFMNRIV